MTDIENVKLLLNKANKQYEVIEYDIPIELYSESQYGKIRFNQYITIVCNHIAVQFSFFDGELIEISGHD